MTKLLIAASINKYSQYSVLRCWAYKCQINILKKKQNNNPFVCKGEKSFYVHFSIGKELSIEKTLFHITLNKNQQNTLQNALVVCGVFYDLQNIQHLSFYLNINATINLRVKALFFSFYRWKWLGNQQNTLGVERAN